MALLLGLLGPSLQAASITPLGTLPGGQMESLAFGISADGAVVVGSAASANGEEAFRWTSGAGMVGLGDLPGDEFDSRAYAVSADGSVVVGESESASGQEAFRWTSGAGMDGLGDLSGGDYFSRARAVSADGSVVVGYGTTASGERAFRWTSSGGMTAFPEAPPGGLTPTVAYGVSANGSVVVGSASSANGVQAFRWTSGDGVVGLGDLAGGFSYSEARGVSSNGAFVVGQGTSANGEEAFRWTAGGGMVGLGDLPGRSFSSEAWDVSADGSVVTGDSDGDNGQTAFLWTEADGMRSLWDVLLAKGVDLGADGWTSLLTATAVSDDGRYVVGAGLRNGNGEAFLVDLQGGANDLVISNLEIPADGSDQAGVGIVSGWHCTASVIEVVFDNLPPITAGSRTTRNDTAGICGDADNGFSLLWAYSLLGEGQHTAVLYADGVEFARSQFNVTLINGQEFVTGASGAWVLENFPVPGHQLKVKWSEASQNLVIFGSEPMD